MAQKRKATRSVRSKASARTEGESAKFGTLGDGGTSTFRLKSCVGALSGLLSYRDAWLHAQEWARKEPTSAQLISESMADRAYEAEIHARILIHSGLCSLNDLRDSGALGRMFSTSSKSDYQGDLSDALETALGHFRKNFGGSFPGVDASPIDQLSGMLKTVTTRNRAKIVKKRGLTSVRFSDASGRSREVRLMDSSGRFASARVNAQEMFNGAVYGRASVLSRPEASDCHRAATVNVEGSAALAHDFYGQAIGIFATLRDVMYDHARRVDELGLSAVVGRKKWWEWLIWGIVAVVALIVILLVSGGDGKGTVIQVCGPDPSEPVPTPGSVDTRATVCTDIKSSSSNLDTSMAGLLLTATTALAALTSGELNGGDSTQPIYVLPIQV